jgi:Kef-type K+ transport system membrane component KefB
LEHVAHLLLQLAIIVVAAKLAGEICERLLGQPAVLGEIVAGVLVGGSAFRWVDGNNEVLAAIAEIGAVLLLFEVGLETDLHEMRRVGKAAMITALVGVVAPFALGYGVSAAMGHKTMESVFIGAALTATSVGVTARVFSDLRAIQLPEARIVLGAAVADDVIGLIILAAVSGLAVTQQISAPEIASLTFLALAFLGGSILIGLRATPYLLKAATAMRTRASVSSAAVAFCLVLASLASLVRLAPIVGAFAAGVILAKAQEKIHFEDKVKSIADLFIPVFFVIMGARMDITVFNPLTSAGQSTLAMGGGLLVVAILGKLICAAVQQGKNLNRWLIGFGMVPRGEVGLIFAGIGLQTKVLDQPLYSALILVVIGTTFVTPPLLKWAAKRGGSAPAPVTT